MLFVYVRPWKHPEQCVPGKKSARSGMLPISGSEDIQFGWIFKQFNIWRSFSLTDVTWNGKHIERMRRGGFSIASSGFHPPGKFNLPNLMEVRKCPDASFSVRIVTSGKVSEIDGSSSYRLINSGGFGQSGPQFNSKCDSSVCRLNADIVKKTGHGGDDEWTVKLNRI